MPPVDVYLGLCKRPADVSPGKSLRQETPGAFCHWWGPLCQPGKNLHLFFKMAKDLVGASYSVTLKCCFWTSGATIFDKTTNGWICSARSFTLFPWWLSLPLRTPESRRIFRISLRCSNHKCKFFSSFLIQFVCAAGIWAENLVK